MKTAIPALILILSILLTTNGICDTKPVTAYDHAIEGMSKGSNGDYKGAMKDFDKAITLNTKDPRIYVLRGHVKADFKQYVAAIKDFNKTIELYPDYTKAYIHRGDAKMRLKQYFDAIADYDKAIELDPKNADAYGSREDVKAQLKQYVAAIVDYDKAIELCNKAIEDIDSSSFGKIFREVVGKKRDDAPIRKIIKDLNTAMAAHSYIDRGEAKVGLKQYFAAIRDFDKAIELDPKNGNAYIGRGNAKVGLKQYAAAIKDYDKAKELNKK